VTSFEIEQKYRIKRPGEIRSILKKIKAKKIASGKEINEFFDHKGSLRSKKIALRVRRYDGKSVLTLKGPRLRSAYTKRMELEMSVDYHSIRRILTLSGLKPFMKYQKFRELYRLGKADIALDKLNRFGWFLEIEGTVREISRVAKALGLKDSDRERRSYLGMLFNWKCS